MRKPLGSEPAVTARKVCSLGWPLGGPLAGQLLFNCLRRVANLFDRGPQFLDGDLVPAYFLRGPLGRHGIPGPVFVASRLAALREQTAQPVAANGVLCASVVFAAISSFGQAQSAETGITDLFEINRASLP